MHSLLHYGIKMVMERFWLHVLKNSHREFQRLKVSFLNTLFKSVIILLMQLMFRFHMLNFQQHKSPIRTQLFFLVSTSCFFGGENCCCYVCFCRRCTCWSCDLKLIFKFYIAFPLKICKYFLWLLLHKEFQRLKVIFLIF